MARQLVSGRAMDAVRRMQHIRDELWPGVVETWQIRKGQRWGLDTWRQRDALTFSALWRADPRSPKPLGYASTRDALTRMLRVAGLNRTDARALRIGGAIWWMFVEQAPIQVVERIGHWARDSATLRQVYLQISDEDAEEIALRSAGASSAAIHSPTTRAVRDGLERLRKRVDQLLASPLNAPQVRRFLIHQSVDELNAVHRALYPSDETTPLRWADTSLQEESAIDELLRSNGLAGGRKAFLADARRTKRVLPSGGRARLRGNRAA
jgi:hypothetical protein